VESPNRHHQLRLPMQVHQRTLFSFFKTTLVTRLVSPENIDEVFDLFSEDALPEFPFFKSIGIPARLAGRETIGKQIAPFVKNETENFRFHDIKIWHQPNQTALLANTVLPQRSIDPDECTIKRMWPVAKRRTEKLFILSNTETRSMPLSPSSRVVFKI
jgi:hypothetical protein